VTHGHTIRRRERGTTLLEALISLSVLLVGMLGLIHLQVYGLTANGGARAHTVAVQLAKELASGLERVAPTDAQLAGAAGPTVSAPPAPFGTLLQANGSVGTGAHVHEFDDAAAIPGARLDTAIERDAADATLPAFRRRWAVWDTFDSGSGVATKVIAVSVVYNERGATSPREVVLYTQVSNRGLFGANIAAYN
jgi:hypothetical protein